MGFFSSRRRRVTAQSESSQSSEPAPEAEGDGSDAQVDNREQDPATRAALLAAALDLGIDFGATDANGEPLILASSEDQAGIEALAQLYVPVTAREASVRRGPLLLSVSRLLQRVLAREAVRRLRAQVRASTFATPHVG